MSGEYITGTGQVIFNIHAPAECQGRWCVIHNPAPGPWQGWPTHWIQVNPYSPANGAMTRVCPHGMVHPCAEDNVPMPLLPHHPDCDGCPCGPEHIGAPASLPTIKGVNPDAFRHPMAEQRPLDANGQPAKRVGELSLSEKFMMDQDEATATEALNELVGVLMGSVLAGQGNHPGRWLVPTEYLVKLNSLTPAQIKIVLQIGCWALAENALLAMERDGVLMQAYGVRLGKGFHDDHE